MGLFGAYLLLRENWQISLTMIFGSFIAGATSEGGGAVAFPVFTKLLHINPLDAKVFSLAIQSVGMTAASVLIIASGIKVEWRIIRWASIAGIPGLLIGAGWLAPMLSASALKMSFTFLISTFAITLYLFNKGIRLTHAELPRCGKAELIIIMVAGFFGGIMSGMVGSGIDILNFSVMVLLFHMSEKVATPTSVVLMSINSIFGFFYHYNFTSAFSAEVQNWWLSAIPVVVIGAPLGALLCSRMNRHTIANILILLIGLEFVTSLWLIPLTRDVLLISSLFGMGFASLYLFMSRVKRYQPQPLKLKGVTGE
jgi:uncharacterized membrane protein YfcA